MLKARDGYDMLLISAVQREHSHRDQSTIAVSHVLQVTNHDLKRPVLTSQTMSQNGHIDA